MRRPTIIRFSLILLFGTACSFAADKVNESPFPGARPLPEDYVEPLFPDITDADAEIYQKLNMKTSVNFEMLPLSDVLESISKTSKLPIILDVISLEEAGLRVDDPITLQISNIPTRSILRLILDELDLDFVVEDAVVKVTSFGVSNRKLTTGLFPVSDLVTEERKSWKTLSKLIQGETDGLWEKMDGSGGTVWMSRGTKSFVVRQTPEVLGQVQRILTFLRAAKRISEHRVNPPQEPKQEGGFGFGEKKRRRGKGLGGFQGGGNFF
jgi:hypothetical protein